VTLKGQVRGRGLGCPSNDRLGVWRYELLCAGDGVTQSRGTPKHEGNKQGIQQRSHRAAPAQDVNKHGDDQQYEEHDK